MSIDNSIVEGNKVIAIFCGKKYEENEFTNVGFPNSDWVGNLEYHSSWDWLMPCYDKFRCLVINGKKDFEERQHLVKLIYQEIIRVNIYGAYDRLVEAIEWYNSNQKQKS